MLLPLQHHSDNVSACPKVITISGYHSKSCLSTKMGALQKKFVLPRGFPAKLLSKYGSRILLFFLRLLFYYQLRAL
jgi:hypothetical protein